MRPFPTIKVNRLQGCTRLHLILALEIFKDTLKCSCKDCEEKKHRKSVLKRITASKFGWLNKFALVASWVVFALAIKVVIDKTKMQQHMYDPFEALGIMPGADEKAIKRAYKIMSMKWHPDKAKDEETRAINNAKFVDINRAYKTLTDEVSRRNWEEHGNPDGPTTFSLGIALPSWLVSNNNTLWVLGFYCAAFGILLPWLVARSWNSSKKYTKNKIMHTTMVTFYREMKPVMSLKATLELLCMADEFSPNEFPWSASYSEADLIAFVSKHQDSSDKFASRFDDENADLPAWSRKVFTLLYAHVHRIRLPEEAMRCDQILAIARAVHLTNGILNIAFAKPWTVVALNAITVGQFLVQACWEQGTPLIQLPGFDHEKLKQWRAELPKCATLRDLLEMPEEKIKPVLSKLIAPTPEEYENVFRVAKAHPDLNVLDVAFRILGQDQVTVGGIVTCSVKVKVSRLEDGLKMDLRKMAETARAERPSDDVSQFEFDEDGNVVDRLEKEEDRLARASDADRRLARQPIHAPFYPMDKRPFYWVMLMSADLSSFLAQPIRITDLVGERTVTMQFQAPNRVGSVSARLLVRSDCLFGGDIMQECKFVVCKEPPKSPNDSDWDISDSESESQRPFGQ